MTIYNNDHHVFTSVAWDLAHEQLVLADAAGVVQIWNTYTESVRSCCLPSCSRAHTSQHCRCEVTTAAFNVTIGTLPSAFRYHL